MQQMGGFSVRPPDPAKHKDLLRRQQIAEKARPRPKASEMRFEEVLDPHGVSEVERQAARERWVADMQAKADPVQIRRAARERQAAEEELQRQEEREKREKFEKQWHEREACRQAEQQRRTVEVNAESRRSWPARDLPACKARPEAVMPPEDVDFGAVRRRLDQTASRASNTTSTASASGAARNRASTEGPARRASGSSTNTALAVDPAEARERMRLARLERFGAAAVEGATGSAATVGAVGDSSAVAAASSAETAPSVELDSRSLAPPVDDSLPSLPDWLASHGLGVYTESLLDAGYDDVLIFSAMRQEELAEMCELVQVKPGHRVRFRRAIEALGSIC